jgi:hypothetical protein
MSVPKLNPPFTIGTIVLNPPERHWRWSKTMDQVPNSAVIMAIGLLIIIWVFLLHMMVSQAPDEHLRFLLDLNAASEEGSKGSLLRGSPLCLPDDHGMEGLHQAGGSALGGPLQRSAEHVQWEVPLLFTTSLRGRGL